MKKALTVGSYEVVSLPELGTHDVIAKVDTGAYSGAVHCTKIKVVKRGLRRRQVLVCCPAGKSGARFETDNFTKTKVRSSSGHQADRYLIHTKMTVQGATYELEVGLVDRSEMSKPVLIGRKFLRENNMLVDVRLNIEHDEQQGDA